MCATSGIEPYKGQGWPLCFPCTHPDAWSVYTAEGYLDPELKDPRDVGQEDLKSWILKQPCVVKPSFQP